MRKNNRGAIERDREAGGYTLNAGGKLPHSEGLVEPLQSAEYTNEGPNSWSWCGT